MEKRLGKVIMFKKEIKILPLYDNIKMPEVAYNGESAAIDFYSAGEYRILPGEVKNIDLGIKIIIPKGYFLMLYNKSSMKYNNRLTILGGVIDRGYTGRLVCRLRNIGDREVSLERKQKVCQGFLLPSYHYKINRCSKEEFTKYESKRKDNGFGSTN